VQNLKFGNLEGFCYCLLRAQHTYLQTADLPIRTTADNDLACECLVSSCQQLVHLLLLWPRPCLGGSTVHIAQSNHRCTVPLI